MTLAESDVVVGHDFRSREKQQIEVGVTGGARFVRQGGATPRVRGRLSAAIGCTQPTIRAIAGGHGHVVEAAIGTVATRSRNVAPSDDPDVANAIVRGGAT